MEQLGPSLFWGTRTQGIPRLPIREVQSLARELLLAVKEMHDAHSHHGDIKTENIFSVGDTHNLWATRLLISLSANSSMRCRASSFRFRRLF
jgi:serine/threonine protein kinase